ncbi:hypothetical protein AABB24_007615, partial [Solanum stoloniferum]
SAKWKGFASPHMKFSIKLHTFLDMHCFFPSFFLLIFVLPFDFRSVLSIFFSFDEFRLFFIHQFWCLGCGNVACTESKLDWMLLLWSFTPLLLRCPTLYFNFLCI